MMESNPRLWFAKAMALGNDFVLWPGYPAEHAEQLSRALADRRYGVGCDQIVFFDVQAGGVVHVRFHNADGSEAEACGNGTRCLVRWLVENKHTKPDGTVELITSGGKILGSLEDQRVSLTYNLPRDGGALMVPEIAGLCRAVFVGNPHLICWTDRFDELTEQGPILEQHPFFEARTNVGFARVRSDGDIDLRVWERGTGLTPACGSGALGAAYAGHLLKLTGERVRVHQEGGALDVVIHDTIAHLTGEAHIIFEGHGHPHDERWSSFV